MVAKVWTVSFHGIEVIDIEVQVQMTNGLPSFSIVGLPDKAVAESRERIRNALHAMGLSLPAQRITVNLAPASVQKEGSHYDLPIALGILAAMGVIKKEELVNYTAVGEVSLDGTLLAVPGILPAAFQSYVKNRRFICPHVCGSEAAWITHLDIVPAPSLLSLVNFFKGNQVISPPMPKVAKPYPSTLDFTEVRGQYTARRAFEIAAAGGHNLLMSGPPGAGKSMLANRLPTILPDLEPPEALELSMIYSVGGLLPEGRLLQQRPFRDPHHSASLASLIGGGHKAKPGEISLAHKGVLFLDELPEFSRGALESLRQPLESGKAVVSRANAHITYPADIQLIAAMNPCPCGYLGDVDRSCRKVPLCGEDYQKKISGPLLDRIDLHISLPAVPPQDLAHLKAGEPSEAIKTRVIEARYFQKQRNKNILNSRVSSQHLEELCNISPESQALLVNAAEKFKLSARSYYRILKVARTIADLAHDVQIGRPHMAEALSYRTQF
ncbi:MAG: YifB family Mg chelatase-like AAA ATPase [Alphaproteobacteria bacterium]